MDVSSVTVGLPVGDLEHAVEWYRRTFEISEPDLEPVDGVVELQLGPLWLQLYAESTERSGAEVVTRLGVANAAREHERMAVLGIDLGPLEHVEGAVDYFEFADPYGNLLSVYSETE